MMKQFVWLVSLGATLSLSFGCIEVERNNLTSLNQIQSARAVNIENIYLPPRKDFRIVVISDLNSQYGSTEYESEVDEAIALIPQWQPDLVLSGGDAIAGQKASLTKAQINAMWAAFDRHVAAPLREAAIPFGFTIGNHDGSGAIKDRTLIFERERDLARAYWQQQQAELGLDFVDRANFPFYYSFQQNNIFFLVWDASTHNISPQQLDWIERALASPPAQEAAVKIAIGHLPLYPVATAKNKPGEYLAQGKQLRSLLEQNRVLMYISGHHHAYYPGKIGDLKLLHTGALGQGARQLIGGKLPPSKTVTVIDLELEAARIIYTTYNAETWKVISIEQLPASIPSIDGDISRHDL